ncbi:MAG: hypothetical protein K8S27_08375 [Candidatus Omnitrophica bacterium]|nr:hypothetical protein [Candidatus Omnitrophota bacterium]
MADEIVVVKGYVQSSSNEENSNCKIKLFSTKDEVNPISWRDIDRNFKFDFTISPYSSDYYFRVSCDGNSNMFKSQIYNSQEIKRKEIDLGLIELK